MSLTTSPPTTDVVCPATFEDAACELGRVDDDTRFRPRTVYLDQINTRATGPSDVLYVSTQPGADLTIILSGGLPNLHVQGTGTVSIICESESGHAIVLTGSASATITVPDGFTASITTLGTGRAMIDSGPQGQVTIRNRHGAVHELWACGDAA